MLTSLLRGLLLFFGTRTAQDVRHAVVAFMAGVFDEFVLIVVPAERERTRPGCCPDRGIVDRELVPERVGTRPGINVRSASCFRPIHVRVLAIEVPDLDDERVAVPPAARIAEPLRQVRTEMRSAIGRNDARFVDHLLLDRDEAGALHDLQTVVVDAAASSSPAAPG